MKRLMRIWHLLGISIYEGKRREQNLKTISFISLMLEIPALIGIVHYFNSPLIGFEIGCMIYFSFNLAVFYLAAIKKNRELTVKVGLIFTYIASTNIALLARNGFATHWTFLFPLIVCYLFSVRSGIIF